MLNLTSFNIGEITSKVSFNSPSTGIIQKSHPRSKFIRFHYNSPRADRVFSISKLEERGPEITILQIMVFGDGELLVEYVYEKDLTE